MPLGPIVFEIWQSVVLNTYSCKLNNCQCSRRSATCWAQRVDIQVDWPNSSWDMRKYLKPYCCKLNNCQCSRRNATCWAQRVDTQVDCPIVFEIWQMFQTLIVANWIIVNVANAAQPAEDNALTLISIDPTVFEIWQNVWNIILANWRNNSVFGAAQPAEHNALTLRSIGPIVPEIWQNVSHTFLQIK
jgi:hypothetical protein